MDEEKDYEESNSEEVSCLEELIVSISVIALASSLFCGD